MTKLQARAAPQFRKIPARYYVATYGDGGLVVELFTCPLAYGRAVNTAQRDHARGYNAMGEIDTWTCGDTNILETIQ